MLRASPSARNTSSSSHVLDSRSSIAPPEGLPPYRRQTNSTKLTVDVRERVERLSYRLYLSIKKEKNKGGRRLIDKLFRSKLYGDSSAPLTVLRDHFLNRARGSLNEESCGGFKLGAECPSRGLCTMSPATYDLPWFTKLLNLYLNSVTTGKINRNEIEQIDCDIPDVFTSWELTFARNSSGNLSGNFIQKPCRDKDNASVSSISTSFGDYEGADIWIGDAKGETILQFNKEIEGLIGSKPGTAYSQRTNWISYCKAVKMNAILPFKKDHIRILAFSTLTALRLNEEERRHLELLDFAMPKLDDARFMPHWVDIPRAPQEKREYDFFLRKHREECDKMSRAIAKDFEDLKNAGGELAAKGRTGTQTRTRSPISPASCDKQTGEKERSPTIVFAFDLPPRKDEGRCPSEESQSERAQTEHGNQPPLQHPSTLTTMANNNDGKRTHSAPSSPKRSNICRRAHSEQEFEPIVPQPSVVTMLGEPCLPFTSAIHRRQTLAAARSERPAPRFAGRAPRGGRSLITQPAGHTPTQLTHEERQGVLSIAPTASSRQRGEKDDKKKKS